MPTRLAVVYYSSTGHVHRIAEAITEGARWAGADVRLRRAAELAPAAALDANPAWRAHADATADVPVATLDDLRWADGFAFETPSRFGTPAAQLKQFIDTTGGLWAEGALSDKAATVFGSADNAHGGVESTLLGLSNVFYHWGAVLVPPGYTDDSVAAAGGNPYGTTHVSGGGAADLDAVLAAARHQGARLARVAAVLRQLRRPAVTHELVSA
ncbi:NAD(P)H:quinone oxidoreductase [Euzebya pacifica]|uniref:NAD(P)H:quinone oxidoreductase n=1 Tax=Euzebya pacifica TaxID=1608957 RepID=UPI0030FD1DDC